MAKLITKFKFIRPGDKAGSYLKYIATREGVDKIDDSKALLPASVKQKDLIEKILRDFPDTKDMHEYEDYIDTMTVGTASEFITRALEDNAQEMMTGKTYADYIATRPRAQRFGSHGLFTDDGVEIKLSTVSEELNLHQGNVWTAILSLRREDAERLGFDDGYRWRDMLRTQTEALSKNLKIPMEHLKWFAAFHNESHHPHVHLIIYSTVQNEGYLTKQGVNHLRSSFAKDIFAQDLLCVYEKQTEHRDTLKTESKTLMGEIIEKINAGTYDNPAVENLLLTLAGRLSKTGGKKVYGYLKADVKTIIDSVIDELEKDERISALYDLWCEKREEVIQTYSKEMPPRIPISQNKEFKSIKNMVIQEAMHIAADRMVFEDSEDAPDPDVPEPDEVEIENTEKDKKSLMWRLYSQAKERLNRESESYKPGEVVRLFMESANLGCGVAKYQLGKLFLKGEAVPKNVDYALRWLEEAVNEENQYAEYLLGKTFLQGVEMEQDLTRAEDLLKRSSNQGNCYAKYTLGKAMLDGILPPDIEKALELITESADSGFSHAQYLLGKLLYRGEIVSQDLLRAIDYLEQAAGQKNPYAAYLAGKIRLTEETVKDTFRAVKNFEIAAENGNDFAEYMLGKLYLYGKEVERDDDKAMFYLTSAAEHGNRYAAHLLHSIKSNRHWSAALGSLRLLGNLARLIQNRLEDERRGKGSAIDRKLKRKIDEKKQAHGLKQ